MKDIDFDELDRAVSSLLGKPEAKKSSSEPVADQDNTPDTPAAQATASPAPSPPQPSSSPASTTPPPSPQATPSPSSPAATPEDQTTEPEPREVATPQPRPAATETESNNTRLPITPSAPAQTSPQPDAATAPPQPKQPGPAVDPPAREEAQEPKPAAAPSPPPKNPSPAASPPSNSSARPPAASRTGRFMDVMHPSASTGTESQQTGSRTARPSAAQPMQSAGKVSRVGRDIKAPSATAPSPQTPPTEVESAAPQEQHEPPQPQPEEPAKATSFSLFGKKSAKNEPLLADKTKSHPETAARSKPSEEVASPFLSDAKVEKRPLGSMMSGTSQAANEPRPTKTPDKPTLNTAALETEERPESTEAAAQDDTQQPASALPPELKKDIVAVESAETSSEAEDRPDTPPALPPEKKPAVKTARSASEAAASNATLSIPQQYKAKAGEPDTTPRSIYDTDEYHKPLSAPSQKKKKAHPIVWVLLIVLLLAVGAGLGVAAYFVLG